MTGAAFPNMPADRKHDYPVTAAWHDLIRRVVERVDAEPPTDNPELDQLWADGVWRGSIVGGLMSAIAALESRLYEIRMATGMSVESQLGDPGPWEVSEPDR